MDAPTLDYATTATRHVHRRDPVLRPIIKHVGPYQPNMVANRFQALAYSILSQQISTKAAASIRNRLLGLIKPRVFNARNVQRLTHEQLRSVGLSRGKALYLHDLADWVATRRIRLEEIHDASDEEVIEELIQVKGIGRWTAEMFLIFSLGRPDVLPVDDLGLRAGLRKCDGLAELPTKAEVRERGAIWAPYRSVATWYLWQSLK